MTTTTMNAHSDSSTKPTCAHYWIIDPPDGLVSPGTCKLCGEGRTFKNYFTNSKWNSTVVSADHVPIDREAYNAEDWRIPRLDDEEALVT